MWGEKENIFCQNLCEAARCVHGTWAASWMSSPTSGPMVFLMEWGTYDGCREPRTSDGQFTARARSTLWNIFQSVWSTLCKSLLALWNRRAVQLNVKKHHSLLLVPLIALTHPARLEHSINGLLCQHPPQRQASGVQCWFFFPLIFYHIKITYMYLKLLYQCYYFNNQTCNITKRSSNLLGKIGFL